MDFDGEHQRFSRTLLPRRLMNPQLGNLAASAPRMTTHGSDDATAKVPYCRREFFAIEKTSRIRVELVDPFGQKRFDFVGLTFGKFNRRQFHSMVLSSVRSHNGASTAIVAAENPRSEVRPRRTGLSHPTPALPG